VFFLDAPKLRKYSKCFKIHIT